MTEGPFRDPDVPKEKPEPWVPPKWFEPAAYGTVAVGLVDVLLFLGDFGWRALVGIPVFALAVVFVIATVASLIRRYG